MVKKNISIVNIVLFFCICVCCILCVGCPTGGQSVLWTLKDATLQIDNSLSNNLDILAQTKAGTNYYIACGTILYTRPDDGNDWTKIDFPANTIHCSALAYFNGRIYAGFISQDGKGNLYSTDPSPISWSPPESDSHVNGKQIVKLTVLGSNLVISTAVVSGGSATFSLCCYDGTYRDIPNLTSKSEEVISVLSAGTTFWALTEDALFNSTTTLDALASVSPTGLSGSYKGMLYSPAALPNPMYYISNSSGVLFISTDGIAWTASSQQKVLDKPVMFKELAQVRSNILVGTKSCGFFQMNDGDTTFASFKRPTDLTEFINSDLYSADVRSFFIDSDGTTVFFCTAGQGLFRNTYSGIAWDKVWVHE